MEMFVVGGAVRDVLMNKEPKDIDFCVVGATPEMMKTIGFTPVAASSFPIFLDKNGDEYALARTERKTGNGYHGFEVNFNPSVTLEEDLFRRDLTINSMAVPLEEWDDFVSGDFSSLIDPFSGMKDIKEGLINPTSIHFKDDPVRALRALRFASRYGFSITDSTLTHINDMLLDGELDHLTNERVWLEIEKTLKDGKNIEQFFERLHFIGVGERILPNWENLVFDFVTLECVRNSSDGRDIIEEFVVIFNKTKVEDLEKMCEGLKLPHAFFNFFKFFISIKETVDETLTTKSVMNVFKETNAHKHLSFWNKAMNLLDKCGAEEKRLFLLNAWFEISLGIGFSSLSEEQQHQLQGPEIGEAIWKLKEIEIEKLFQF